MNIEGYLNNISPVRHKESPPKVQIDLGSLKPIPEEKAEKTLSFVEDDDPIYLKTIEKQKNSEMHFHSNLTPH